MYRRKSCKPVKIHPYYSLQLTDDQLEDVAIESSVLEVPDDYLKVDIEQLKSSDCKDAFVYLKQHFRLPNIQ